MIKVTAKFYLILARYNPVIPGFQVIPSKIPWDELDPLFIAAKAYLEAGFKFYYHCHLHSLGRVTHLKIK